MKNLMLVLWTVAACTATAKPAPTEEPEVDDAKADSLRTPSVRNALVPNEQRADELTAGIRYLGYPIHLDANQTLDLWVGGVASDGSTLDTIAYFYGPVDTHGRRGTYLAKNDDRDASDYSSRLAITASRGAGDYLIVVTTYAKPDPGHVIVTTDFPRPPVTGGLGPHLPFATAFQRIDPVFAAKLGDITLDVGALSERFAVDANDPVVTATDLVTLMAKKVLLTQRDQVAAALDAAAPSLASFQTWPERAQRLLFGAWPYTTQAVDDPARAAQVQQMVIAAWPGSSANGAVVVQALARGATRYGYEIDVPVKNAAGDLFWTGRELFGPSGQYLGELQTDFDNQD